MFAIVAGATALVYETIHQLQRCSRPKDEQPPENVGSIVRTTTAVGQRDAAATNGSTPAELEPLRESQDDSHDTKDSSQDSKDGSQGKNTASQETV